VSEPGPAHRYEIVVVEDDAAMGQVIQRALTASDRRVRLSTSAEEALLLAREGVQLVVADYRLQEMTGLDLLRALRREHVQAPIIMVSGESSVTLAVEAMRAGALDFLQKPLDLELLRVRAEQALAAANANEELESLRRRMSRRRKSDLILGVSAPIAETRRLIGAVAQTDVAVAVYGETGTGKELVARTLHEQSVRKDRAFVVVDCAAIPEALLENELFGHEAGAFTGADRRSPGLLSEADGGTVFIDEVGEMPLALQSKLLRFVETHQFRRVGAQQPTRVDARVVCATNRDLAAEVTAGRFRADLYYRLNVFPIRVPALRARAEDIPILADHFLRQAAHETKRQLEGFEPEALEALARHPWPGNVRQLENAIRRIVVLALRPRIGRGECDVVLEETSLARGAPQLPPDVREPYRDARERVLLQFDRDYLGGLLAAAGGNVAEAARRAGLDRKNLWVKLKKQGLIEPERRPPLLVRAGVAAKPRK
jgi:two-component system response regulator HydG